MTPYLSPRQFLVALIVSSGYSNKEAGHLLSITEGTVKVYLREVYGRLGLTKVGNSRVRLSRLIGGPALEGERLCNKIR